MEFEWDPEKLAANLKKHGIDLEEAVRVFDGLVLTTRSDRSGEPRWKAVGMLNGVIIAVVYTWRGARRRIISARMARRNERREYHAYLAG